MTSYISSAGIINAIESFELLLTINLLSEKSHPDNKTQMKSKSDVFFLIIYCSHFSSYEFSCYNSQELRITSNLAKVDLLGLKAGIVKQLINHLYVHAS